LNDVYGLNSLSFESDLITQDHDRSRTLLVKTHDLPFQLKDYSPKKDKVIYIVRDGRDAICSLAYKRKNLIEPSSDLQKNFEEATYAEKGSFFGGWDYNCRLWLAEDPILIRFEDLIANPKQVFQELEKIIPLPKANWDELPTFEKQKSGKTKFGFDGIANKDIVDHNQIFFRKGGTGNWKTEMPMDLQQYFWNKSDDLMYALGYSEDGKINPVDASKIKTIADAKFFNYKLKNKLRLWSFQLKYRSFKKSIKRILLNK